MKTVKPEETNAYKAKNHKLFKACCIAAKVDNTTRQYSKFINGKGIAFKHKAEALKFIK